MYTLNSTLLFTVYGVKYCISKKGIQIIKVIENTMSSKKPLYE